MGYADAQIRSDIEEWDFKNHSMWLPLHGMRAYKQDTVNPQGAFNNPAAACPERQEFHLADHLR